MAEGHSRTCTRSWGTEMMSYTATLAHTAPPMMDRGNERLRLLHPQSHQGNPRFANREPSASATQYRRQDP
jgi:hypothetical protein